MPVWRGMSRESAIRSVGTALPGATRAAVPLPLPSLERKEDGASFFLR